MDNNIKIIHKFYVLFILYLYHILHNNIKNAYIYIEIFKCMLNTFQLSNTGLINDIKRKESVIFLFFFISSFNV